MNYRNGDWYKGNWKKNIKEGTGKYYYAAYSVKYKGEFKEDLRWGNGKLIFDSGDIYQSNWIRDAIEDGHIHIKYKDNSEYEGESKQGKRSGYGKIEYINGGSYHGSWDNDQKSGRGIITYKADVFYEGIFAGDYTDGPGVLVRKDTFNPDAPEKRPSTSDALFKSNNGCIDKLEFFNDISEFPHFKTLPLDSTDLIFITLSTKSSHFYLNKTLSPGKFVSGRLIGGGMAKYGTFGIFYGNFLNGNRSGYGKMTYTDPDHLCHWFPETEGEYIGEWKEDKRHGIGRMLWSNGTLYEGKYNFDRRHNVTGKVTFQNGDIYDGGWVNDRMEGSCTVIRKGVVIKGQFIGGVLSNFAKIEYADERVYEGDISNNAPHGTGKMKWPDNAIYNGGFCEGIVDGMGRMAYSNGDIYEGNWENGSRNGRGTMIYANSKYKYEGEWVDDKRCGEGVLRNHRGDAIKSGFWSNNELIN